MQLNTENREIYVLRVIVYITVKIYYTTSISVKLTSSDSFSIVKYIEISLSTLDKKIYIRSAPIITTSKV